MTALGRGGNEDIQNGIPPNMDILLVEQEVEASDEITALQMVVAADERRTALLKEQADIEEATNELRRLRRLHPDLAAKVRSSAGSQRADARSATIEDKSNS